MRRTRSVATLGVAAVVLLSACGSSGEGSQAPATEDGLRQSAQRFGEAILSDSPGDTYDYLSAECKERWKRGDWGANVTAGVLLLVGFAGLDREDLTLGPVEVLEFSETSGTVSQELLGADGESMFDDGESNGEDWFYEDGGWRIRECESIGDGLEGATTGDDTDERSSTTIGGDLTPAGEAAETAARADATTGSPGEPTLIGSFVVTVSDLAASEGGASPPLVGILTMRVRVENRSASDSNAPIPELVCSDGRTGNWYSSIEDTQPEYEPYDDLPSGSFLDGTFSAGYPADCGDPVVRIETPDGDVDIPLPLGLI